MDSDASASLGALAKYFSLHSYGQGSAGTELNDLYALRYQIYCLECHSYPFNSEREHITVHAMRFSVAPLLIKL